MEKKEHKSKEYAKEQYPYTEGMRFQCEQHFESGWDEALRSQWVNVKEGFPEYGTSVLVVYKYNEEFQVNQSIYLGEYVWRFGYSEIIAWMPIPSFDKILEDNKDVLKRLKNK